LQAIKGLDPLVAIDGRVAGPGQIVREQHRRPFAHPRQSRFLPGVLERQHQHRCRGGLRLGAHRARGSD